jgi:hypothetical protein
MHNEMPTIPVPEVFTSVNTITIDSGARVYGVFFVAPAVVFYVVARLFRRVLPFSIITISVCGGTLGGGHVRELT